MIFLEIYIYFKDYKLVPLVYILISFIFFLLIDFNQEIYIKFNLFILVVITFDIFSYIVGKSFGKIKLIKISPNKTIEGLLGGLFLSFFSAIFFAYYLNLSINFQLLFYIFLIIISAFTGDLIESFFKRMNSLKNSSEFIPGHGGVFDRFDSFLFSIIVYSISIIFLK